MDQEQLAGFLAQLAEQVNEPAQDAYFVLGSGNEPWPYRSRSAVRWK